MIAALSSNSSQRVITVAPMPPEKLAYALARYSRSPDSIRDSIEWVRTHDSTKFLESFYFQYGHASIADLGHVTVCFEGVSETAAIEIEDEQLWDGQARSSRYQDFSKAGVIVPPELTPGETTIYNNAADALLQAYRSVKENTVESLIEQLPRPAEMKPDTYRRNIEARAFDVARYLLPLGIPTGVGQVTSIRTLEKQIRRFKASEYAEVRELGDELSQACARPARCAWNEGAAGEAIAPTLARHAERDDYPRRLRADVGEWAKHHLPPAQARIAIGVDLLQPGDPAADLCASLLYPVTTRPYRELYDIAASWPSLRRNDLFKLALGTRGHHDELPRQFRSAPFVFDFVMDIGAYRDFHRHRRCYQLRQFFTNELGYDAPEMLDSSGSAEVYRDSLRFVDEAMPKLPRPASDYLLPFAARSRFLFKMDFAELEYIAKLRSGVKGHFSYRKIAWEMKEALARLHPDLANLVDATPPWIEDPLKR